MNYHPTTRSYFVPITYKVYFGPRVEKESPMTQGPDNLGSMPDAVTMRSSIRARLRTDVPAIANLYEIGLGMVENSPTEAHKYFIGHAMREIRTRLPLHYGVVAEGRFDYAQGVEAFASDWISEVQPVVRGAAQPLGTDVLLRRAIATDIDALVDGHRRVADRPRDLYLRLSERISPTSIPAASTYGIIEQWLAIGLHGMAHIPGPKSAGFSLSATLNAWNTRSSDSGGQPTASPGTNPFIVTSPSVIEEGLPDNSSVFQVTIYVELTNTWTTQEVPCDKSKFSVTRGEYSSHAIDWVSCSFDAVVPNATAQFSLQVVLPELGYYDVHYSLADGRALDGTLVVNEP